MLTHTGEEIEYQVSGVSHLSRRLEVGQDIEAVFKHFFNGRRIPEVVPIKILEIIRNSPHDRGGESGFPDSSLSEQANNATRFASGMLYQSSTFRLPPMEGNGTRCGFPVAHSLFVAQIRSGARRGTLQIKRRQLLRFGSIYQLFISDVECLRDLIERLQVDLAIRFRLVNHPLGYV